MVFTATSFETLSIRTHSCHPEGAFRPKDLSDSSWAAVRAHSASDCLFGYLRPQKTPHSPSVTLK